MNPKHDKLIRRTTMVATVTAAYLLLTADYGEQPSFLDPIKKAILSAQKSVKEMVIGTQDKTQQNGNKTPSSSSSDNKPHP